MKDLDQTIIDNYGMTPMINTVGAMQRYQSGGTVLDASPSLSESFVRNKDGFACPLDVWDKRVSELVADGKLLKL